MSVSQCGTVWGTSELLIRLEISEKSTFRAYFLWTTFPLQFLILNCLWADSSQPLACHSPSQFLKTVWDKGLETIQFGWLLSCTETLSDLDFEEMQLCKWNMLVCVYQWQIQIWMKQGTCIGWIQQMAMSLSFQISTCKVEFFNYKFHNLCW